MPRVSVIMSIYNGNGYDISDAIQSLLNQNYTDFELIIVNDGSSSDIEQLLQKKVQNDQRIRLIKNQINIGLTRSLNIALSEAKGYYIARMDADDLSYPNRLHEQVSFLDANPEIALIGSRFDELIEGKISPQRLKFVCGTLNLKKKIIQFNPFCHSTVMIRKYVLDEFNGYDEQYYYAQDYDLWLRIADKYSVENLDLSLLIRRADDGISVRYEQAQRRYAIKARFSSITRNYFKIWKLSYLVRPIIAYILGNYLRVIFRKFVGSILWTKIHVFLI